MNIVTFFTSTTTSTNLAQSNWYLILLFMILGSIAACLVLFMFTKNPKEWQHVSLAKEMNTTGKLKDLAESIKAISAKQTGYLPIQGLIKRLFFEKVKSIRGLSDAQMQMLYKNDQGMLQTHINDAAIIEWIVSATPQQQGFHFFEKEKKKTRDQTMINLKNILEKMEAWNK